MTQKLASLLALLLCALAVSACGAPGDTPAENFAAFLEKHRKAIDGGTFNQAAFEAEGAPIIAELKKHVDPKSKRIEVSDSVRLKVDSARQNFDSAAKRMADKGDSSASASFYSMDSDIFGE